VGRAEDDITLEGFHALKHAHRFGGAPFDVRVADRAAALRLAADLAPDIAPLLDTAHEVGADALAAATSRPVPTGVLARARRPVADLTAALERPGPVVLLDQPRDPGNAGAAIRVAAAAGAAAVLVTGTLDPWHPVCVRGAAGLQFAQPVLGLPGLPDDLGGRDLVAVVPDGDDVLGSAAIDADRAVLAFGTERHGLGDDVLARARRTLAIPMRQGVSSLNLATAVAVVLYGVAAVAPG